MERSFQVPPVNSVAGDGPVATRERVIDAAADLFATYGYAGTSISAIRKASGVLPSSIDWEFGNKQGVLAAVLEDSAGRWLEQAAHCHRLAIEQSSATGIALLGAFFTNLAEALAERPEFLRLLLLLALERREVDAATVEAVRRARARARHGLVPIFRRGGLVSDAVSDDVLHELARLTLAFADGAFVAAQIDPATTDLKRMFAIFHAGMVAALAAQGTALIAREGI
jgi:AcrR family transcriptional regulator